MNRIPFDPIGGILVKIPVMINGTIPSQFLLDTGAGVNLISERLCAKIGGKQSGSYTGKRMTGEELTLRLTSVPEIKVGPITMPHMRAGVLDLFEKLPKELGEIDGALSLRFFESLPFTIDYTSSRISLEAAPLNGTAVPLHLERDHEKTIAFLDMAQYGRFEVDTGNSTALIHLEKAPDAQVALTSLPELRTAIGGITQLNPRVSFRPLIHDGVIGNDFFQGRRVTFDLPSRQLWFR